MRNEAVLALHGVGKVYHSGPEALSVLKAVDLEVSPGESVVITGESGSGKSTLLHLAAGLDQVSSGTVRLAGRDITGLSEYDLAPHRLANVGLVFQFHYLLREFTAVENVMLPAMMAGRSRSAARARAESLLAEVDLSARSGHYPVQLSGGERQRVAVARALINEPALILADEPTGNLDEGHSRAVEDLLMSLLGSRRAALVLVTHDSRLAARGDRVLRLHGGGLSPEEPGV